MTVTAQQKEAELQAELLRSTQRNEYKTSKNMREVLRDMFKPNDYVKIKNHLPYPVGWVYTNPEDEVIEQPSAATRRVTFGEPKSRILKSGQSVVVRGGEAYVALVRMFKQYAQVEGKYAQLSNNMPAIESFIGKAYQGLFTADDAMHVIDDEKAPKAQQEYESVDDQLGFKDEDEDIKPKTSAKKSRK